MSKFFTRKYVLLLLVLATVHSGLRAQLSLTNGANSAVINFSSSMQTGVGSNPSTAYSGAGFSADPTTAGRLNSNAWAVTGWSDGSLAFGGTQTTVNDFGRGSVTAAQTTGGMYAFTGSPASVANPMLLIQPGGSDFAPGTLTLRIKNNGSANITQLAISYNLYVRNDQARSSSFNFSHSADNTTYTAVPALNYTSDAAIDALGLVLVGGGSGPSRTTTITGLNIAPGAFYYIRWSGADVGGSGSRDEFGLDDITATATYSISSDANLSALSATGGTFVFSPGTTNYSFNVNNAVNSTTINATASDASATISINGGASATGSASATLPLAEGNNTFNTVVTAADLSTKTYTITINRAPPATPVLSLTSSLAAFGTLCVNNTAGPNSFTLNGNDLDGSNIVINAQPGLTYAETPGGTYTSSLSFSSGAVLSNKIIYVKFTPVAAQSYSGNISVTGGGTSVSVPVSATGVNTMAAVTTGSNNVAGSSVVLSGSISSDGCSPVSSYGFEYSTTANFANGTGIQVTAANLNSGAFSKTISGLAIATTYYYKAFAVNNGGTAYGAQGSFATSSVVPVVMSAQPLLRYTENFNDVANWGNNFASGIGANRFSSVAVGGSAAIPNATRIVTSSATFASGSGGGVQKGTGSLVLLATGASPENGNSVAVDFYMDFTGVNAGTLSFDWSTLNNGTGDRFGSLRVYGTTDGINFTELTSAAVLNFVNGVPSTGTVNSIALPAYFSNSATARLRFYYHNGTGGTTGSRPKINIDNLIVTGVASTPCETPGAAPTGLTFGTITETSIQGSFTAASPAANEYLVIMSTNSSLTNNPIDGQTYVIGDNVGDGTVIAKGNELNFTAADLTGATTYYFFVFSVNSVCTGGPKYLTTDVLEEDATTVAGLPTCAAPAAQPAGLTTTASINSIQGSFTATVADEYLVLQSTSASLSNIPVNGVVYNAGAVLGNATVVQRNSNTNFTASGLQPETQYYYYIFSINSHACVNGPVYNTASPLSGSATTLPLPVCVTPSAQPSSLSFNASNNSVTATFNPAGAGLNYFVVMSTASTLSATPVDNMDYATGAAFGGGKVISNSTSTSFIATGLNNATTYYFFIFSSNKNCTGGTKYLVTSPLTGVATTTNAPVNNYYYGNLHAHTDYSDGSKDHLSVTPADAFNYASASQGMDFLGVSEHNHFSTLNNPGNEIANYHMGSQQAAAFNATHPNFLALYGMEFGVIKGGGHVLVYGDGMTELFGWESNVNGNVGPNYDVYVPKSTYIGVEGLFKNVNDRVAKNTFASLAHPNSADFDNLSNIPYDPSADDAISGVAVESGPATSSNTTYTNPSTMQYLWYYQKMLAKGYHLGPMIDHDNHNTTFGRSTPARTAVIAPALTQSDIIKSIRDMHFYATEDIDARVDFTINTRIMGSIFEDRNAPSIAVNLTDATNSTSNALIRVMFGIPGSEITPVAIDSVVGSSLSYVDNSLANHATGYYYIDILNAGKRIVTSPIWYTRTCASASDTTAVVCGTFNWYGTEYTSSTTATKIFATAGGCDSTVTLHLTISQPPTAATIAVAGSDTGCPGTGVALTASAVDGGNGSIISYQWIKNATVVATTSSAAYTATESGSYSVRALNASGCSVVSGSVNVTVTDNIAPIPTVADLPSVSAACSAVVTTLPTATDNCAGLVTATTTDPLSYTEQGTYTIHWIYNDGNGNTTTQEQTVTIADTEKPTITAPMPYSVVNTPGQCGATVTLMAPAVNDNCGVASVTNDHPSTYFPVGTTIVTWKVTDIHGNVNDTATTSVTVIDNEEPVISVMNVTVNNAPGACEATVTLGTPVTSDNCGVASVTNDHPSNIFPVGTTNVKWTVTDNNGWTSTAIQIVTVTDTEKPTITAPAAYSVVNTTGQCGATVVLASPVTGDNCGVQSVTNNHPSTYFPVGTTVVKWIVTDIHGNINDTATTSVTVIDNEVPTISVSPVTANATANCSAVITLAAPVTSDNCGVASVTNNHPSNNYPVGTTNVVWTVTDNNGWTNTATQTVTVTDNAAPVVITQPVTVYLNAAGTATVTAAQVNNGSTDNCTISNYSLSKTSFNCSNVGNNTVVLTVTDNYGNTASANAVVTVQDNIAPVAKTQALTVYLNAAGNAAITAAQVNNGSTDNCSISSYSLDKTNFNCSNIGANTVVLTVTDASGNTSAASAVVTVKDNTLPTAVAQAITVYLNAAGTVNITAAQLNNGSADNCGIASYSINKTSFTCANIGNNSVILTVTDASGNTASATAVVTVKDNLAPVITAVPAQTFCTGGSSYSIPVLTATDNCSAVTTSYTITGATSRSGVSNNASGTFNAGVSTINWTVKDASGNVATSSTTVTISVLPAATITASNADAFCNKITLTATAVNGATYKWTSGSSVFATTQQVSLGQTNGDGNYQVTISLNGCTSAPATYNFQKQNLISSYTLLAFNKIDLGTTNIVGSGSVGVTGLFGEVELGSNSTVNSPGSFVKARFIDKNGYNISISNPIYTSATGITLPTMLLNTANANNLPNKDVPQNSVSTLTGNYRNLTLKKGSRTTLTGTVFGNIRVEQGAQVTFTAATINIDNMQVVKGPRNGYSYVRFATDAKVLVSSSVTIGSQVFINPDNNNVTFYMGDKKSDEEKFTVNGGDTKVNANIYIPNGKLKVTGGYRYGDYGFGFGDCDRDDDEDKYFGQGTSFVNMTGVFIAENITGNGKNVIWNSFDCNAAPVPVTNSVITQSLNVTKESTVTTDEDLKVTVLPNPSSTYFTLKIASKYETPVSLRVMDSRGRVIDSRSKLGANSTIQIGHQYAGGTFYAELIQGDIRKVVQLVKIN